MSVRSRPRGPARVATSGLAALCLVGAMTGPASAQALTDPPRPGFRAEPRAEGIHFVVDVPEGWALYAPVLPSEPEERVGLPLRIEVDGTPVVPIRWPDPVRSDTPLGPAWVHPAGTHHAVLPLIPGHAASLRVTWALCRGDLCVPGRSLVVLPEPR